MIKEALKAVSGGIAGGINGCQQGFNNNLNSVYSDIGEKISKIKDNKPLFSDSTLKEIYGDDISDDIVNAFAKIDSARFTYKPEAQKEYAGNPNMDNKEHIGVIAQQLEADPVTAGTVERNENGDLEIKTGHLTAENTAVIGELSRRVLALETAVKELTEKK